MQAAARETLRYRRFVVNVLSSAGGRVAAIVMALLLATVMVRVVGMRAYGTWAFFAPLIGYSGLFDFGLTITTERTVARLHAQGDSDGIARAINSAITGSVVISILILLGMWLVPPGLYEYLGDPAVVRRCLIVLSGAFVWGNVGLVVGAGLSGLQQVGVLQAQRVATNIAAVALVVSLALSGVARLDILLFAYSMGPLATLGLAWWTLGRSVRDLRLRPLYVDWAVGREMVRFAGAIQVANLSLQLGDQAFRLMSTARFGPEFLAMYDLAYRAGQALRSLSSSLLVVMVPFGAARSVIEGSRALSQLHSLAVNYVSLFVATGTAAVLFQSRQWLAVWLGPSAGEDALSSFLIVLLVTHGVLAVAGPMQALGRAAGRAVPEAVTSLLAQIVGLGVAFVQPSPVAALVAFASSQVLAGSVAWMWIRRSLAVSGPTPGATARVLAVVAAVLFVGWMVPLSLRRIGAAPALSLWLTPVAVCTMTIGMTAALGVFGKDELAMWRSLAGRFRHS